MSPVAMAIKCRTIYNCHAVDNDASWMMNRVFKIALVALLLGLGVFVELNKNVGQSIKSIVLIGVSVPSLYLVFSSLPMMADERFDNLVQVVMIRKVISLRLGIGLVASGFLWFFGLMSFIPDTIAGAVLLFVPSTILVFLGFLILLLRVYVRVMR
jgi:hypothetical protein